MNKKRIGSIAALVLWLVGTITWYLHSQNFQVLNPAGQIAGKERHLIIITVLLGLLVVVPVYILTFAIAWRYREGNRQATYSPELTGNRYAEALWWAIPSAIILVLSIIAWNSSHALDPFKPLATNGQTPLTIQVVALDWKWLFIYPDQNVASVNYVQIPVGRPVNFYITADAPMNSFWVPQLGGQIYAMPGMSTQLHLIADKPGLYTGSSANLSGDGFADMRFTVAAGSQADYQNWLRIARSTPAQLTASSYHQLAKPSTGGTLTMYSAVDNNLYNKILLKFMVPGEGV